VPLTEGLKKEVAASNVEALVEFAKTQYEAKEKETGEETFRQVERMVLLRVMDMMWMEHIDAMMKLREAIGLHGYAQKDPLVEYKQESYMMFQRLQAAIAGDVARLIYRVRIATQAPQESAEVQEKRKLAMKGAEEPAGGFEEEKEELASEMKNEKLKIKNESHSESQPPNSKFQIPNSDAPSGVVRDPNDRKEKVGRNDPCPCGSGKKFKKCHGK